MKGEFYMSENPHGISKFNMAEKASVKRCGDSDTHRHVCMYSTNIKCAHMKNICTNKLWEKQNSEF